MNFHLSLKRKDKTISTSYHFAELFKPFLLKLENMVTSIAFFFIGYINRMKSSIRHMIITYFKVYVFAHCLNSTVSATNLNSFTIKQMTVDSFHRSIIDFNTPKLSFQ